MKAVVVLSGGQDSATCLALAVRRYGAGEVAAVTFEYGQRHALETRFARRLVRRIPAIVEGRPDAHVQHKVVKLGFYGSLTTNALMDPSVKIGRKPGAKCPNTVVEGRNAVFLTLAAVWAKTLGATELYTGVSEADYSGYPDCRGVFIKAQQKAIRLALDYPIRIVTPFAHRSKAYEWALAAKLGILDVVRKETVTCYNGIPGDGCGECPACRLRARGYGEWMSSTKTTR
ncbi:MAG: 7-cyano-7-deazaguanine synthase QueC [Kiritimatiellae bacterium]|nr:7-cyano-7-deazaguanine synthase QueC [Kiritimatiellia bacterium]